MQAISAALAFAIIMLILAMITSTLVEMIHRALGMREKGLRYLLEQMYDQVLARYAATETQARDRPETVETGRKQFADLIVANRAPIGMRPDPTHAAPPVRAAVAKRSEAEAATPKRGEESEAAKKGDGVGKLWNGREMSNLTVHGFMERLGSQPIGDNIVAVAKAAAKAANIDVDKTVNAVLQDIAQKFEALGKDASTYFERRARTMSVILAVVLAFALHVDPLAIFSTLMRDQKVTEKVLELQKDTIDQFAKTEKAKQAAVAPAMQGQKPEAKPGDAQDGKAEVEELQKDYEAFRKSTQKAVSDLSGLGVPIGWNKERIDGAQMWQILWTCPKKQGDWFPTLRGECASQDRSIWAQIPTVPSLYLALALGGLLIGLGAPFWADAVNSLTSIRNIARSVQSVGQPAPVPPGAPPDAAAPGGAGKTVAQPQTPVDVFKVANDARQVKP